MSPHAKEDENVAKAAEGGIEGEIKIDHSKPKPEPTSLPDEPVEPAPPVEAQAKPLPPPEKAEAKAPMPVSVPGGVKGGAPNPNHYFRSKYKGRRHPAPVYPIEPPPVFGAPIPAPQPVKPRKQKGTSQVFSNKLLWAIGGVVLLMVAAIMLYVFIAKASSDPLKVYLDAMERTAQVLEDSEDTSSLAAVKIIDSSGNDGSIFSEDEVNEIQAQALEPLSDYIFTNDTTMSVFANVIYIGEDQIGDAPAYHYSALLDQTNFDTFCQSVAEPLASNKSIQELTSAKAGASKTVNDFCVALGKQAAEEYDIDVWVAKSQKVIHTIKFVNRINLDAYVEFTSASLE